jgi:Cof subfamily protein (haloacid dehalogenase superfamily)
MSAALDPGLGPVSGAGSAAHDGPPGVDGIRLLLADVDGTIINSARTLTPATIRVARTLRERGIALAITSSRPPRGLLQFIEALEIDTPTGAFNGGVFVKPDLSVISQSVLPAEAARQAIALLEAQGLDVWAFTAEEWYVRDPQGAHVARESETVRFKPEVVDSYEPLMGQTAKIVGVTDDPSLMAAAEQVIREGLGGAVSASRSQTYYLDITHPDANKGRVLAWISAYLDIPSEHIATIGDGPNDVLMFRRGGLSIAMGNASPEVKAEAGAVTASNAEDGFARAVETHILSKR